MRETLTLNEVKVLIELNTGDKSIRDLSNKLNLNKSTVKRVVDSLIKKGYLSKGSKGQKIIKTEDKTGKLTSKIAFKERESYFITYEGLKALEEWRKEVMGLVNESKSIVGKKPKDIHIAIANENIVAGDLVKLYFKDGYLYASKVKGCGDGDGIAYSDGEKGEAIAIKLNKKLKDIWKRGRIILFKIPTNIIKPNKLVNYQFVTKLLKNSVDDVELHTIATFGTIAYTLAKKLNLNIDIKFGVMEGICEAYYRGCDVLVLVDEELLDILCNKLKTKQIPYILINNIDYDAIEIGDKDDIGEVEIF